MAVFTEVTEHDARVLLTHYDLGEFVSLRGIAAGIENTNYFLTTTAGDYVLTVFEVLTSEQLPFYIELMHELADKGIPVPSPQTLRGGSRLTWMHGKPATIVTRLAGACELSPGPAHCELAGTTLARAHLAAADFSIVQPNLRGLSWWTATVPKLLPFVNADQAALLADELDAQQAFAASPLAQALPRGPSHCDMFRDNVLFDGSPQAPGMGGIIDFYFAGWDYWLFDVAICVNDWCIDLANGRFKSGESMAWLTAYSHQRPFTDPEREAWPMQLRAAAFRFWLSRLYDLHLPRAAQTLNPHDPRHFERVLRERRTAPIPSLP